MNAGPDIRHQARKQPRGAIPARANGQRDEILALLREAKSCGQGVNKAVLLFQYRYTQAATRIFELERQGYVIEHRSIPGERFVTFFLVSEPAKPAPVSVPRTPGLPFEKGKQ